MKTVKAVRYEDLAGKTVAGVGHDGDVLLIAFTDGTVLALSAEPDCEGGAELDYVWSDELDLETGRWASAAEDAGLITHEAWKAVLKQKDAERVEHLRAELARLEGK